MFKAFNTFLLVLIIFTNQLFSQVNADFELVPPQGCPPFTATIINTSNGTGSLSFVWDFGKGNPTISNSSDTLYEFYPDFGIYTITLIASNGSVSDTMRKPITVFKNPTAEFSGNNKGCIPWTVNFIDQSIEGDATITDWFWDFRNNTYSTDQNPNINYNTAGDYDIILRVTDQNGCADYISKTDFVQIENQPIVSFNATPTFSCTPPLTTNFTNYTNHPFNYNYIWDFGNGITSTQKSPDPVIYNTYGQFNVSLSASNDFGCLGSQSNTNLVNIFDVEGHLLLKSGGVLLNDGDTICPYDTIHAVDSSFGANISIIDFVGINKRYIINSTYQIFPNPGYYEIKLYAGIEHNCTDTVTKTIYVDEIIADFEYDTNFSCSHPFNPIITDNSTNAANWMWVVNQDTISYDQNPTVSLDNYAPEDSFSHTMLNFSYFISLKAISSFGCTDNKIETFTVNPPLARFMPNKSNGCAPLNVTFSDSSQHEYNLTEFTWIYGDGSQHNTPDSSDVLHTYNSPGEYYSRLIITNEHGCIDTSYAILIEVGDYLTPDFDVSPKTLCYNEELSFTDLSSGSQNIDYWDYRSSVGIQSNCSGNPNPTLPISPLREGEHSISLRVSYNGCQSSITKNNIIYVSGPVGHITNSFDCDSAYVQSFNGNLFQASNWTWQYGDGDSEDNISEPSHTYLASGDYTINLTATNDTTSCILTDTRKIMVRNPQAYISLEDTVCRSANISLSSDNSIDYIDSCFIETFLWEYGDSTYPLWTYKPTVFHAYEEEGDYIIKLTVNDINGCVDSVKRQITVVEPEANFTVDTSSGCTPGYDVLFINTLEDTTIVSWIWDFADDSTNSSGDTIVLHSYSNSGSRVFNSRLTVYDKFNCENSHTIPISIFSPNAGFNVDMSRNKDKGCRGVPIQFFPHYSLGDSLLWNFGDSSLVDSTNFHSYNKKGTYTVSLIMYEGVCVDTFTIEDYISIQEVDAGFSISDTIWECYPTVDLSFKHLNIPDSIVNGAWLFGDDNIGILTHDSAKHEYIKPDTYHSQLWVETSYGCRDTASIDIEVNGPWAEFTTTPDTICQGNEVLFQIIESKDVDSLMWYFGDGNKLPQETITSHTYYNSFGLLVPKLYVYQINVCYPPPIIEDSIYIYEAISDFIITDNITCEYEPLPIQNNSVGVESWLWDLGNGETYSTEEINYVFYDTEGEYEIQLIVQNNIGCRDTSSAIITIYPLPSISASENDTICRDQSTTINVIYDEYDELFWHTETDTFGFNTSVIEVNPTTNIDYIVNSTDSLGCTISDSINIHVIQYPNISITPEDTTIIIGEIVQLQANSSRVSNYEWNPFMYIDSIVSSSIYIKPMDTIEYNVEITDDCFTNTLISHIKVRREYTVDLPAAFTPNGDGINDVIYVRGWGIMELLELKIYNRWGNLVYSSNNLHEGWDGFYKEKLQPVDSYAYTVKVLTWDNEELTKKGTITILK